MFAVRIQLTVFFRCLNSSCDRERAQNVPSLGDVRWSCWVKVCCRTGYTHSLQVSPHKLPTNDPGKTVTFQLRHIVDTTLTKCSKITWPWNQPTLGTIWYNAQWSPHHPCGYISAQNLQLQSNHNETINGLYSSKMSRSSNTQKKLRNFSLLEETKRPRQWSCNRTHGPGLDPQPKEVARKYIPRKTDRLWKRFWIIALSKLCLIIVMGWYK